MNFTRKTAIVLICATAILPLNGQLISVRSEISSDSMLIGDQLVYTLHVDAADHVEFMLPDIRDTLSRNIEVLFPVSADTVIANGRKVVDQRYMVTGFEPGLQLVPSQRVIYRTGESTDTARSMPLMLRVFEPAVDTTQQIMPIKPPINTPLTLGELLPWIAVGISGWFILTLIYAVIWV